MRKNNHQGSNKIRMLIINYLPTKVRGKAVETNLHQPSLVFTQYNVNPKPNEEERIRLD